MRTAKPVKVSIGFYILDFARITSRDESFDVTGYLELSSARPEDGSLELESPGQEAGAEASMPRARSGPRASTLENALEQPRYHFEPVVEADDDGLVTSWAIVSGKFSVAMDLRRSLFDRQVLPVRIGTFEDESVQTLEVNPALVMVDQNAFVTDWTIEKPTARVEARRFVPGQEPLSVLYLPGGRQPRVDRSTSGASSSP